MRTDEPRICIHCHDRIARDGSGNWTYAVWALGDRIPGGIGLICQGWAPGRLRGSVDAKYAGRHFPGILILDTEKADV